MSSVYDVGEAKTCREKEESSRMEETTAKGKECDSLEGLKEEQEVMAEDAEEEEEGGHEKAAVDPIETTSDNWVEGLRGWDYEWPWNWSFEERMLWGPFWWANGEAEVTSGGGGGDAEHEEVMWEDDVWQLKEINEIPEVPNRKRV